jgi:AcrR family transcriptional regulator
MRITAETKIATGQRILHTAARLFSAAGWDNTTTREIAAAAGIATGTLFNYFQSKEAIAATLISEALEQAQEEFEGRPRDLEPLEEALFSFIWTGFKRLRGYRKFLSPAAETIFSPLAQYSPERPGDSIRVSHLEAVERIISGHSITGPLPVVTLQLYWTLYLGVFGYWAADPSPNQEDTLALLDQSLNLFIASLATKNSDEKRRGRNKHDQRESE